MQNSEYVSELRRFFISTWDEYKNTPSFKYRVYFAPNSLNLNEIFVAEMRSFLYDFLSPNGNAAIYSSDINNGIGKILAKKLFNFENQMLDPKNEEHKQAVKRYQERFENTYNNTSISQSAFLLKAPELLEEYKEKGRFSSICLIETFAISGRDYSEIVNKMILAFHEIWGKKYGNLVPIERINMDEAFLSAITMRTFVLNDKRLIIDSRLIGRVNYRNKLLTADWLCYVKTITDFINQYANNTFLFTIGISYEDYQKVKNSLSMHQFRYETCRYSSTLMNGDVYEAELWQRSMYSSKMDQRFWECICCHCDSNNQVRIIPYIFIGLISKENLLKLFQNVANVFEGYDDKFFHCFTDILRSDYDYSFDVKLQLCMTILSILRYFEFMKPIDNGFIQNSNLQKITQNYGCISDILLVFKSLCDTNSNFNKLRNDLGRIIEEFLCRYTRNFPVNASSNETFSKSCRESAEDYCVEYDFVMRKYQEINRNEHLEYSILSPYRHERLIKYLNFLNGYSFEKKISELVLLCQTGIIRYGFSYFEDDNVVYSEVMERTCLISIFNLFDYLPALISLEDYCDANNKNTEYWSMRFGRYLDRKYSTNVLVKSLYDFVSRTYHCGMQVSDWSKLILVDGSVNEASHLLDSDLTEKQKKILKDVILFVKSY